jgi:hypothetical protein
MKRHLPARRRLFQITKLPIAGLIALLQRSPAVQAVAAAEEFVMDSPVGAVLRSAAAAAAALGAVHSMAGATALIAADADGTITGPLQVTAGAPIPTVVFSIFGTQNGLSPGSWTLAGSLPPGLSFDGLTGPGLDSFASSPATLVGTPTQPGTYVITLTAYLQTGGPNDVFNLGSTSSPFPFTIVVSQATIPAFTTNPQSATITAGQMATFTAAASGGPSYRWDFNDAPLSNGGPISGATTATLTITGAGFGNAGSYTCVATNPAGSATSTAAVLTVNPVQAPTFTLNPEPQTVNTGSTVVFTAAASGAASYQWTFNGSPISDSTSPGGNDIKSGSTGPQLVIANATGASNGNYALMAANSIGRATSPAAQLQVSTFANPGLATSISNRALVGTGDSLLIGGFFVSGSTSRTVLVQAIGPGLGDFGVTGFLAKPTLSIHQTQNGHDVTLYSNTGFASLSAAEQTILLTAAGSVFASPTLTSSSLDSELLVTLPPGGYSAEVSGADGGTGVALCAVYELP